MPPKFQDEAFLNAYTGSSCNAEVMEKLDISNDRAYRRRKASYEKRHGELPPLVSYALHKSPSIPIKYNHQSIKDFSGSMIIFSDAHFRESEPSDAFSILLKICDKLKPDYIINNGDAFDGAAISRFPRIGWEPTPSVLDELKATQSALSKIKQSSPESKLLWNIGNHDSRYGSYLSSHTSLFEGVEGFRLEDHFKDWKFTVSTDFNNKLIVKHRYSGGAHSSYNNTLKSGVSIVTGHTHRLNIRPYSDYNGTRYGIETGTLASPYGSQFGFCENANRDWQSGFCVISMLNDRIYPELIEVKEGSTWFRGEIISA